VRDQVETLGEVAWDVLQRIVRELLARKPGGHLLESDLRRLDLRLPLTLDDSDDAPERFAERLVRTIDRLLDDAVQRAAVFRPGHAYCHRCDSAACEHSTPPSCRHVFTSYSPTGTPRWEDFAQLCLNRKHPEVDRLYQQPPAFLTLVQEKPELHSGMLQAFDNGSYELLGQITAGFFPVHARAEEGRGVLALTVQAAASRPERSRPRFGLNLLGRTPAGEELKMLWERQDDLPWRRAVRWAQSALHTLDTGGRRRISREALQERIGGIMRGLARRLERDQRARGRRTRHAEQRHLSGERPTRKAVDDARDARDDAFMVDESSGAIVVLGERGRTHFFTGEGQLVSSVRYGKEAVARKIKYRKWREAKPEEREALRSHLADRSP
jgi:hypothetical protein